MATQTPTTVKDSESTAKVELTDSTKYHLLANKRRRLALAVLHDHGSMPKSELGERVAARELDTSRRELDSSERKSVLNTLHQGHLGKLADAGAVIWDQDGADHVYHGPTFEEFVEHVPVESEPVERGRVARAASALGLSG